jgi:superfamily II DNA or RNA helicase
MSTTRNNLMGDFYAPCLSQASSFDRAAGYFSSAIFGLMPMVYSDFFERGGKIRIVTSTQLSAPDALAIGETEPGSVESMLDQLRSLDLKSNSPTAALARIFASLLASKVLELRLAQPISGQGVFHDKYGIFSDENGAAVSFIGSSNETAFAWSGLHNHEQIEIFRSSVPSDRERIEEHLSSFDSIWNDRIKGYKVFPSEEFESEFLRIVPPEPLSDLLLELRKNLAAEAMSTNQTSPTYNLRDYQREALENWENSGKRGSISFATGGGKTLTAIEAIKEHLSIGPAIVLLPSRMLLDQWRSELRAWIPEARVLQVGAGVPKSKWAQSLYRFTQAGDLGPRIVLSTYRSATTDEFRLGVDVGDHLLLVADEVHGFGAPDTQRIAEWLDTGSRLGLSATPIRARDLEGTDSILNYFGAVLDPVYTLQNAIRDKVLVPYDYFVESAPLSEDELLAWDELSKSISKELAMNDGKATDRAKRMMIKRARISKRAASKAQIAATIIQKNYLPSDRWLIYCESVSHLNEVKSALRMTLSSDVTVMEFHSQNSEDHRRVISYFESRGGIVLAIKCLDEGIDIPIINRAIVLSSSTNPREYIQRRGRILRRHPQKSSAQLWDLVSTDENGDPIADTEVTRAMEFAESSRNSAVKLQLALMSDRASKVLDSEFDFV